MLVTPDICSEDSDNDTGILDLSLPERKRAPHDDNTNYKKSLLKRYCEYLPLVLCLQRKFKLSGLIQQRKRTKKLKHFLLFHNFFSFSSRSRLSLFFSLLFYSRFLLILYHVCQYSHLVNSFLSLKLITLSALTF